MKVEYCIERTQNYLFIKEFANPVRGEFCNPARSPHHALGVIRDDVKNAGFLPAQKCHGSKLSAR